ncbi:hypothetical protein PFISCL1PPCAC_6176, partial [Pristionchus fissidentatus]
NLLSLLSFFSVFVSSLSQLTATAGTTGCVVTKNKLYSHGNFIRQLNRAELGQFAKFKNELEGWQKKLDLIFADADMSSPSNSTSSLPPFPERPLSPPFCSGKDTILYLFSGCSIQNNKVYVGTNLAREFEGDEKKKFADLTEKMKTGTSNQDEF